MAVPISHSKLDLKACLQNKGVVRRLFGSPVVPHYNDHFYNGNFNFRWNFFGNGSFLMKIYYIITEFAPTLTVIPGDEMHFLTHFLFIKTTEKKNYPINCLPAKIFNLS